MFGEYLQEGSSYIRNYLIINKIHNQDRKGVSGNQYDGCDALIVSRLDTIFPEDSLEKLYFTCNKMQGCGSLYKSICEQIPIRVFR